MFPTKAWAKRWPISSAGRCRRCSHRRPPRPRLIKPAPLARWRAGGRGRLPTGPATQVARQAERLAPRHGRPVVPERAAEEVFYRLAAYVREFEANLDHDHEIGARMVSFGATVQFHIVDMGYWNPDIITFEG